MAIIDNIRDAVTKVIPQKRETLPGSTGHGVHGGEDVRRPIRLIALADNVLAAHTLKNVHREPLRDPTPWY